MNSYELYDNKQRSVFAGDEDDSSTLSREKIQNCSILEIDIDQIGEEGLHQHLLNQNFSLRELQQMPYLQINKKYKEGVERKRIAIGNQYLNLKSWEEKRKKEKGKEKQKEYEKLKEHIKSPNNNNYLWTPTNAISPSNPWNPCTPSDQFYMTNKSSKSNTSNKTQRKRLLDEMINKLNSNQKTMKEVEVDDSIIQKIQNIVGLLDQVQEEIKIKQKCSLGMKLKLKVDPNQRYFKRRDNQKEQYYTSREQIQLINQPKYLNSIKSKQLLNYSNKSKNPREKERSNDKVKRHIGINDKYMQNNQRDLFEQRQYGTQNLYSISHSQKKPKRMQHYDKERNSVQHTTSLIKQKREQIVQKQMRRRQKWYNRLIQKQ